jgi:RNA polymerase sigma-70 factor (ECF subfamily)
MTVPVMLRRIRLLPYGKSWISSGTNRLLVHGSFRIASNHCLRQLEKQNRMPKGEMPAELEDKPPPDTEGQVQLLYKCIAQLPEIDRIIISLELEDVKQAEIAAITGLSESNIRVKVYRIKEKLSQKFKKYEPQY